MVIAFHIVYFADATHYAVTKGQLISKELFGISQNSNLKSQMSFDLNELTWSN